MNYSPCLWCNNVTFFRLFFLDIFVLKLTEFPGDRISLAFFLKRWDIGNVFTVFLFFACNSGHFQVYFFGEMLKMIADILKIMALVSQADLALKGF